MDESSLRLFLIVFNFTAAIINVLFAILIFTRVAKPGLRTSTSLFALLSSMICLVLGTMFMYHRNPVLYNVFGRLTWALGSFLISTAILVQFYLFDRKLKLSWIIGIYLLPVLFSIIGFTRYGIIEITSVFPFEIKYGPCNIILRLWVLAVSLFVVFYIYKNYKMLIGQKKLQAQYVFLGMIVCCTGAIIFFAMLPLLGISSWIHYIPIPAISMLCAGIFTYSIVKQRLLEIEMLAYDILRFIALITGLLILNYLFLTLFEEIMHFPELLSSSLSLILLVLIYFTVPVKEKIDDVVRTMLLRQRMRYEKLLTECTEAVVSILDIDELLRYVINSVHIALGTQKIGIFLKEDQKFKLIASHGMKNITTIYLDNPEITKWLETNKTFFVFDAVWQKFAASRYHNFIKELETFGATLILPLVYKNELKGIMTLGQKKTDGTIFDTDDMQMLQNLAYELAIALENAKLYRELDDAYMNITRALSIAVEEKEGYTVGHSDNVTKYATAIAKEMNLSHKEIISISQAAMLHDIGKIGIHDHVLAKPGKLTREEWEEMKTHSEKGAKILSPLHMISVSYIVTHHHEHYDGTGYPEGLKNSKIPLGAQILSVADSFDAMISERVYRSTKTKRLTIDEALQELIKNKGIQFNPEIVDIFLKVIKENPNIVRQF